MKAFKPYGLLVITAILTLATLVFGQEETMVAKHTPNGIVVSIVADVASDFTDAYDVDDVYYDYSLVTKNDTAEYVDDFAGPEYVGVSTVSSNENQSVHHINLDIPKSLRTAQKAVSEVEVFWVLGEDVTFGSKSKLGKMFRKSAGGKVAVHSFAPNYDVFGDGSEDGLLGSIVVFYDTPSQLARFMKSFETDISKKIKTQKGVL
jgi:hypothetical protein